MLKTEMCGIIVSVDKDQTTYCNFDDYKKYREKHLQQWSEKSFCDWCDKHNVTPVG